VNSFRLGGRATDARCNRKHTDKEEEMITIHSRIVFAAILVAGMGATAQDVASNASKAAKHTGHGTMKPAEATEHGTTKAADKTSSATGHAVKKTAHGVKKGVQSVGHEVKGSETKTTETQK
jgi:hypothetical protein